MLILASFVVLGVAPAVAQITSGPRSGDNQKALVSQWIGPVEINITYSSPDVQAPDGTDRRGKISGALVPWGYATDTLGFCGSKRLWRAGANESTVLRVSHDVEIGARSWPRGSTACSCSPARPTGRSSCDTT